MILSATIVYSNVFVGHSHWMLVKWIPFKNYGPWGEYFLDLVQNLLLFVPLGYAQHPAGFTKPARRLLSIAVTGFVISTGIELFQVYSHNRSPGTTDIIMNCAGALFGGAWYLYAARRTSASLSSPPPHAPAPASND